MHKCKFCLVYAKAVFQLLGTQSSAHREQSAAFTQPEKSEICFVPPLLSRQVSPCAVTFLLRAAFDVKFHKAATFCPEFSGQPRHGMGCSRKTSAGATTSIRGTDGCSKTSLTGHRGPVSVASVFRIADPFTYGQEENT